MGGTPSVCSAALSLDHRLTAWGRYFHFEQQTAGSQCPLWAVLPPSVFADPMSVTGRYAKFAIMQSEDL